MVKSSIFVGISSVVLVMVFLAHAGDPPAGPKVINLGNKVNTEADEVDPFLTVDGKRLLYASNAAGTFNLMVAVREKTTEPWSKVISIDNYNTKDADQRSPYFAKDATLYFASNEVPDPAFKDLKNFDILKREGQRAPFRLRIVNTPEDELHPWVTPRGDEFYFSRKTKDGWRVFVSKGPAFGGPGDSQMLQEFPAGFHHATLSPDGLTMYLQGPLENDRWGIFRATRPRAGAAWTKPKAVVNLNNKEGKRGDMSPSLSPTGRYLYFASDRPAGQGGLDLWMVETAELKVEE